MTYNVLSEM